MARVVVNQPLPIERQGLIAIFPIGLYCNTELMKAKVGDIVEFRTSWRADARIIKAISRVDVENRAFSFLLRHAYGETMTIKRLMRDWEVWAENEGLSRKGFSRNEVLVVSFVKEDCD